MTPHPNRFGCTAGLPHGAVLMDAGYGCNTELRTSISAMAPCYVAGILPNTSVWASGTGSLPPKKWSGSGRPPHPTLMRRDGKHQLISVNELALGLPKHAWRTIGWREGTIDVLSSRFARVRDSRSEEWLLIEEPKGEKASTKYWLSTLPETISFRRLVDFIAKLRWRIVRDYQGLKQEVGLGHYEGRGWRGFHHHATLYIAAYGFQISERETIPPQSLPPPRSSRSLPFPTVTDPEAPPLRPERHIANSIATMQRRLTVALVKTLSRCPCRATQIHRTWFMTQ